MDLGYFSLWCQFPAFKIRIVLIVADTPENGVEIVTGGAIDVAPEKGAVLRQTGMLFDRFRSCGNPSVRVGPHMNDITFHVDEIRVAAPEGAEQGISQDHTGSLP